MAAIYHTYKWYNYIAVGPRPQFFNMRDTSNLKWHSINSYLNQLDKNMTEQNYDVGLPS